MMTLIAQSLLTGLAALAAPSSGAYLEFAVYRVNDAASFPELRRTTADSMAEENGFLWWQRLQGKDDEGALFADVVAWAGPDEANAAAAKVQTDERYAPFMAAVRDIVHFSHCRAAAGESQVADWLEAAVEIEIALYTVKDANVHREIREEVYRRLRQREGMMGGTYLDGASVEGDDAAFGDLLTWTDAAAFETTGTEMQAMPELAPFFQGVAELRVFSLFRRDGVK